MTLYAYSKEYAFHVVYNYSNIQEESMETLSEEEIKQLEMRFNKDFNLTEGYLRALISSYLPTNNNVCLIAPCVDVVFTEQCRDAYKIVLSNEGNDPTVVFASECKTCQFKFLSINGTMEQAIGLMTFFFDAVKSGTLNVKT